MNFLTHLENLFKGKIFDNPNEEPDTLNREGNDSLNPGPSTKDSTSATEVVHPNRKDHPTGALLEVSISKSLDMSVDTVLGRRWKVKVLNWQPEGSALGDVDNLLLLNLDDHPFIDVRPILSRMWVPAKNVTIHKDVGRIQESSELGLDKPDVPLHPNPIDHPIGTILLVDNPGDVTDTKGVRAVVWEWGKTDLSGPHSDRVLLYAVTTDGKRTDDGGWWWYEAIKIKKVLGLMSEPLKTGEVISPPVVHPNPTDHPAGTVLIVTGKYHDRPIEESKVTVVQWLSGNMDNNVLLAKINGEQLNPNPLESDEIPSDRLWFFPSQINIIRNLGIIEEEEETVSKSETVIDGVPEEKVNDDFMYHLLELRRLAGKLGGKVTVTF